MEEARIDILLMGEKQFAETILTELYYPRAHKYCNPLYRKICAKRRIDFLNWRFTMKYHVVFPLPLNIVFNRDISVEYCNEKTMSYYFLSLRLPHSDNSHSHSLSEGPESDRNNYQTKPCYGPSTFSFELNLKRNTKVQKPCH